MLSHSTNLISCPVCYTITGKIIDLTRNSGRPMNIEYNLRAADPPDGNRCRAHARSKDEWRAEALAAMLSVSRR